MISKSKDLKEKTREFLYLLWISQRSEKKNSCSKSFSPPSSVADRKSYFSAVLGKKKISRLSNYLQKNFRYVFSFENSGWKYCGKDFWALRWQALNFHQIRRFYGQSATLPLRPFCFGSSETFFAFSKNFFPNLFLTI